MTLLFALSLSLWSCAKESCGAETAARPAFRYQNVVDRASKLSDEPYRPPPGVPDFLAKISYDAWRDIRFDPRQALWKKENLPFTVQFFHPGFYYDHSVPRCFMG